MSLEFQIRPVGHVDTHRVLTSLSAFTTYDESSGTYAFGSGSFPPAHAHVVDGVITFCVNSEAGSSVLDALIHRLRELGDPPVVTEL